MHLPCCSYAQSVYGCRVRDVRVWGTYTMESRSYFNPYYPNNPNNLKDNPMIQFCSDIHVSSANISFSMMLLLLWVLMLGKFMTIELRVCWMDRMESQMIVWPSNIQIIQIYLQWFNSVNTSSANISSSTTLHLPCCSYARSVYGCRVRGVRACWTDSSGTETCVGHREPSWCAAWCWRCGWFGSRSEDSGNGRSPKTVQQSMMMWWVMRRVQSMISLPPHRHNPKIHTPYWGKHSPRLSIPHPHAPQIHMIAWWRSHSLRYSPTLSRFLQ